MTGLYAKNFLLWKRGEKHKKGIPSETKKKEKTPDLARRDSSNALAYDSSYDASEEFTTIGW